MPPECLMPLALPQPPNSLPDAHLTLPPHPPHPTPPYMQCAVRRNGRMLVLQPSLLSYKPMHQLISEAQARADSCSTVSKVCFWLGGGLVVVGVLAAGDDSRR